MMVDMHAAHWMSYLHKKKCFSTSIETHTDIVRHLLRGLETHILSLPDSVSNMNKPREVGEED